jgi:hypothetical protein
MALPTRVRDGVYGLLYTFGIKSVRDVVYSLWRAFGIDTVFGNPGSTELPMFRDFPDDFRYVLGLQESIVVAMADGYAQARRSLALVSLHSAAGLGHALGSIFTASKNQTPLLIIAGQQARSLLPFDPYLHAREATEFPKPYVKWSCEPARAQDVPAAIAHACYLATQPPCGPVFVSVPVDDWDRPCAPLAPRRVSRSVQGDATLLTETASALNRAQRPAFVVGAALAREGAWSETIALAERHAAAVWVAPMAARNPFPGRVLYLRQRRPGLWTSGSRGRGARPARAACDRDTRRWIEHVRDPGIVVGRAVAPADQFHRHPQRRLRSPERVQALFPYLTDRRPAVAAARFLRGGARSGRAGKQRAQPARTPLGIAGGFCQQRADAAGSQHRPPGGRVMISALLDRRSRAGARA